MAQSWEEGNQRPLETNREHKPSDQQPKVVGPWPENQNQNQTNLLLKRNKIIIWVLRPVDKSKFWIQPWFYHFYTKNCSLFWTLYREKLSNITITVANRQYRRTLFMQYQDYLGLFSIKTISLFENHVTVKVLFNIVSPIYKAEDINS